MCAFGSKPASNPGSPRPRLLKAGGRASLSGVSRDPGCGGYAELGVQEAWPREERSYSEVAPRAQHPSSWGRSLERLCAAAGTPVYGPVKWGTRTSGLLRF